MGGTKGEGTNGSGDEREGKGRRRGKKRGERNGEKGLAEKAEKKGGENVNNRSHVTFSRSCMSTFLMSHRHRLKSGVQTFHSIPSS